MKGSSSFYVTTLPGLVAVGIVVVTSRDHLFKELCDLMG